MGTVLLPSWLSICSSSTILRIFPPAVKDTSFVPTQVASTLRRPSSVCLCLSPSLLSFPTVKPIRNCRLRERAKAARTGTWPFCAPFLSQAFSSQGLAFSSDLVVSAGSGSKAVTSDEAEIPDPLYWPVFVNCPYEQS